MTRAGLTSRLSLFLQGGAPNSHGRIDCMGRLLLREQRHPVRERNREDPRRSRRHRHGGHLDHSPSKSSRPRPRPRPCAYSLSNQTMYVSDARYTHISTRRAIVRLSVFDTRNLRGTRISCAAWTQALDGLNPVRSINMHQGSAGDGAVGGSTYAMLLG